MSAKINMLARRGGDVPLRRVLVVSLKNYGTLTVLDRAIPDYRDGLKPVQRRVLWALHKAGATSSRPFKRKAIIIGDTMKYHPHGDAPISDAMTTMVHDRYPLIEGYGSWGDPVFGEPAGAARYIECRLSKFGDTLFERLPVTDLVRNYSGEYEEPLVLHAPVPIYLVNGSSGIAVGVAFNTPPHNLREIVAIIRDYIKKKGKVSVEDWIGRGLLKGPDYAFGGVLTCSRDDLVELYKTGRGALTFRCRYHFEPKENVLVITSAAPYVNLGKLKRKLEDFVEQGLLDFVRDDSGKDVRILVGYSNPHVVKAKVLPLLHSTVHYRMCLTERFSDEDARFADTNLLDFVSRWVDYRREVERRYLEYLRSQVKKKIREAELTLLVIRHLDDVVKALRSKDAVAALKRLLKITEEEAQSILRKTLSSFTRQSAAQVKERLRDLKETLKDLESKLRNVDAVLLSILKDADKRFGDARRTSAWDDAEAKNAPEPPASAAASSGHLVVKFDQARILVESKPGRTKADAVLLPEYPFLIVTPEGRGRVLKYPDNIKHLAAYKRRLAAVVSLVPGALVVLLDDRGKLLVFPSEELLEATTRERLMFRTQGKVLHGTVVPEDFFLVAKRTRSVKVFGPEDLEELLAKPGQAGRSVVGSADSLGVVETFEEDTGAVNREALLLLPSGQRKVGTWKGPLKNAPVFVFPRNGG